MATPLFGPAALAVALLRYVTPSSSSGIVPSTNISKLLKIDTSRNPAKSVSALLLPAVRLMEFHSAQLHLHVRRCANLKKQSHVCTTAVSKRQKGSTSTKSCCASQGSRYLRLHHNIASAVTTDNKATTAACPARKPCIAVES